MPRRPNDPLKHKSMMSAKDVLFRVKAERADIIVERLIAKTRNDEAEKDLLVVKRCLTEIIALAESEN